MPLISNTELQTRVRELVLSADQIDIAVAWVRPCTILDVMLDSNVPLRIAVGISKDWTDPTTLKRLVQQKNVQLRVVPDNHQHGIFHPKYYCFRGATTVHWVGSANLTGGGFGGNEELVHEFASTSNEYEEWFENLWNRLKPDPTTDVEEYDRDWKPPRKDQPRIRRHSTKQSFPDLNQVVTWSDYVNGIKKYQKKYFGNYEFDVLGDSHSWVHTIASGNQVIRMQDWQQLKLRECHILRGQEITGQEDGAWALLGWVRAAGARVFNPDFASQNHQLRLRIKKLVDGVVAAKPSELPSVASDALSEIWHMKAKGIARQGIGPAAASRWIALARPDYLISINNASAEGLGEAANLPRETSRLACQYEALLRWLHNRSWFNEASESSLIDPTEREIWNRRAALVDVFVYRK